MTTVSWGWCCRSDRGPRVPAVLLILAPCTGCALHLDLDDGRRLDLDLDQVPAVVHEAAIAAAPGLVLVSAWTEREDDRQV